MKESERRKGRAASLEVRARASIPKILIRLLRDIAEDFCDAIECAQYCTVVA